MSKQIVIAGNQEGLQTRNRSFLLPSGAYPTLFNMYNRRQRLRKKRGHITRGRLGRTFTASSLGNSGASPWSFNLFTLLSITETNKEIKLGSVTITIQAGPDIVFTDQGDGTLTSPTAGNSGTINYFSGAVVLTHTAGAGVAAIVTLTYYPTLPVMGIWLREVTTINEEECIVFDTRYAYTESLAGWNQIGTATWTVPTGTDANLFWATNYEGTAPSVRALYITNNVDPIQYLIGTTWAQLQPQLDSTGGPVLLKTALVLAPFKSRLLAFNTLEGVAAGPNTRFLNRLRYSKASLRGPPTDANAWHADTPGLGGFIDAPTSEAIVSVQNLKDRLIVYFETSTWELVYTGNETLPFYFRQINRELGAESTFSIVPFDNGILGVGDVGIHACNGVQVVRIDEQIPDQVYKILNENNGPQRVSGIRDYVEEVVYWTYPDYSAYQADIGVTNKKFPNRVLLYNYTDSTWALLRESFTCYGYYQPGTDYTWATLRYESWSVWNDPWDGGVIQSNVLNVLAGNQQGYLFQLNNQTSANAVSLTIQGFPSANEITSVDHNLQVDDYFTISGELGVTITFTSPFATDKWTAFRVTSVVDKDTIEFDGSVTGTYIGGGEITVLSNFDVFSKAFNDFFPMAQSIRFPYADFLFDASRADAGNPDADPVIPPTPAGEVSVYFYLNDNQVSANQPLQGTPTINLGGNALQPFTAVQNTIWYRKYANAVGQFIQYRLKHSTDDDVDLEAGEVPQMRKSEVAQKDFILNAVILTADPSGRIAP
jgi:hypothetical protein